ncbi:MAG: hypothetical protein ACI35O_15105 [Bacillaceae bacterium]
MTPIVVLSAILGITAIGLFIWAFGKNNKNVDKETFKYANYLLAITLFQLMIVVLYFLL